MLHITYMQVNIGGRYLRSNTAEHIKRKQVLGT